MRAGGFFIRKCEKILIIQCDLKGVAFITSDYFGKLKKQAFASIFLCEVDFLAQCRA